MSMEAWQLLAEQYIPELNSAARLFRHRRTEAELLSIENDDPNKCFSVTVRTLPRDSTGVAHILEHIVLGGSRKYPLKDPFFALVQGSLQTFLNAMTFPDKTSYPVASTNLRDFYNLVDVYLDAVFHPLIRPQSFLQEGWHYESEGDELSYRGVVFNEMKAAWSAPDQLLGYLYALRSLYPDTPYANNSGGDPRVIPELTHEQLREFHATFYHPSNARLMFWGDDPPAERLRIVDEYLAQFDARPVDALPPLQAPFDAPRSAEFSYDGGADEKRQFAAVAWALPEPSGPEHALALRVLNYLLWGTPAAPLRKALLDSGLGEDVVGDGLESDLRQPMFLVGLKGVEAERAAEVAPLILGTMERLARDGFDPDAVAAALNTIEFQLRELKLGSGFDGLPRGLVALFGLLNAWPYGRDPLAALAFEAPLAAVRAGAADGAYWTRLIDSLLLRNPHRVVVGLRPDAEFNTRMAGEERSRLAAVRAGMDSAQLDAIAAAATELADWQSTPDSPDEQAKLPALTRDDLEPINRRIQTEERSLDGVRTLVHDVSSGGIVYLDLGLDLRALPVELLPYGAVLGRVLLETGAGELDQVRLTQRIGRETGGITAELWSSMVAGEGRPETRLFLRGKALAGSAPALAAILEDVLLRARLDNRERLKQIVLEEKSAREAQLAPAGHRFAAWRLRSRLHQAAWATEQMRGVSSLFSLRGLAERIERDWAGVLRDLEQIRELLVRRGGLTLSVAAEGERHAEVLAPLGELVARLPGAAAARADWPAPDAARDEGLSIPAQVNYVARGANLYSNGYRLHGSALVAESLIGVDWLLNEVRLKGGAYGAFCGLDHRSGVWDYGSYRDPQVRGTLEVYNRTGDWLRSAELGERELTRVIVGAVRDHDPYLAPDEQGFTALTRILGGDTEAERQRLRDEVLATTVEDLHRFADALDVVRDSGHVVALGSEEALRGAGFAVTPVI